MAIKTATGAVRYNNRIDSAAFYLEWLNNYLTIQKIADDYGISEHHASCLINRGRVKHFKNAAIKRRLEYLRGEIEAERINYTEIAELQSLKKHIDKDDVLLLQWAGVKK